MRHLTVGAIRTDAHLISQDLKRCPILETHNRADPSGRHTWNRAYRALCGLPASKVHRERMHDAGERFT